MLKRCIKFAIRVVGRSIDRRPRLKKACLKVFTPFPLLRRRLIYIVRTPKQPPDTLVHDYDDLPPHAREIYRQLTGRGADKDAHYH